MPSNYTRIYYHFIWASKGRVPNITPDVERLLYDFIRQKCDSLGVLVYAVNGMPDHVHLACTLPTQLSVADFVGYVKGGSSHFLNHHEERREPIVWQRGYGALTLNRTDLPRIVAYIDGQKEHHRAGSVLKALERWEDADAAEPLENRSTLIREDLAPYDVDPWDE